MLLTVLSLVFLAFPILSAAADTPLAGVTPPVGVSVDPASTMVVFHSETCPYCHELRAWIEDIRADYPRVVFVELDVGDPANIEERTYFEQVMRTYQSTTQGVPRVVVGERVYVGFAREPSAPQWSDSHRAWIGYSNQLLGALDALEVTSD